MKKLILPSICTAIVAAGAMIAPAAMAEDLSYTVFVSPKHSINRHGMQPMFDNLRKVNKGKIDVTLHTSGSLAGGRATLAAVKDGLADGGFVVSLYYAKQIPINTTLSDLALLNKNSIATAAALNETVQLNCPQCKEEYAKNSITDFGAYSTTPYNLMCKSPINSMADLKGLKVRAAGAVYSRVVAALGAVPVTIPSSEAYEGMERGQLDCVLGSPAWLKTYSLVDIVTHVVDEPIGSYFGGSVVNLNSDKWDELSADQKAAWMSEVPGAVARITAGYIADDATAREMAIKKGVKFTKSPKDMAEFLVKYRQGEIAAAAKTAKSRGVKNPEAVINAFLKNLKKWEALATKIGTDPDAYTQALQDEIYSKIKL